MGMVVLTRPPETSAMMSSVAEAPAPTAGREQVVGGRYRVLRQLGQGGMGAVYAVHDRVSERELALKRLTHGANAATAALFEREYQTLAGLRHACIVEVYDYARDGDDPYYTMELIEGSDLSRQAPLQWRAACRDLRDAASILGVLHARRLLHRDLSPRNLLRSKSGRLKLIDFGALADFGPSTEIVGTPPFVAPEALRAQALDQRTDLYALGALAYWLVTGVHAYPARKLSELPGLWQSEPLPPSEALAMIGSDLLEPAPPELDQLIAALLRSEPSERPHDTGELIDRLNAIAGLEAEAPQTAARGYLDSKAFVGRVRERQRALARFSESCAGTPRTLLVEGDAGVGRSRFLQELALLTQVGGATTVRVDDASTDKPFGAAERMLLELLRTLPDQTRRAVGEHAGLLANLSKEVRAELREPASTSSVHAAGELRVRLLGALRDVFDVLSRERALALFIDDVHKIDDESQALLAALAHGGPGHRRLLVAALGREEARDGSPALVSLRGQATRIRLLPLKNSETLELLRSVFGQTPYLSRLAERVHRVSEGNPAYCLELAAHLVETGHAIYRDGSWNLSADMSDEGLPASRQAAHTARLERLSIPAQALARQLSVPHPRGLSPTLCAAVSGLASATVQTLLAELEREHVLRHAGDDGYRFMHAEVKNALYAELDPEARWVTHRRLGRELADPADRTVIDDLMACAHFLRGDDLASAAVCQQRVISFYEQGDLSTLRQAAPLIEDIYRLRLERGHDKYRLAGVLALLGIASYFADRRYGVQYGDVAIATLQDVLRLDLAQRLSRFVGGKLALLIALIVAGVSLRLSSKHAPTTKQLVRSMMGAASALAGVSAICIDPAGVERYGEVMRPFSALGQDHAANITYQFAITSVPHLRDLPSRSTERLREFVSRLESDRPIQDLPDAVKINYLAGSVFMLGVVQSWQDGPECLQTAEKLERFGPLYAMSADYLRVSYYAGQGDLERAGQYRERMEVHAVQLGSAWQVETWAPADAIKLGLRLNDASMTKRAVQELGRLALEVPSLSRVENQARGVYLVLRHKFREAIPLLDAECCPGNVVGWTRARGVLARAYNQLGEYERAKQVCLETLRHVSDADLDYVVLNLNLQLELALAEAGLGHYDVARKQLNELLRRNEPRQSAVTLGMIHAARTQAALLERDIAQARAEFSKLAAYYRSTGVPSLIEQLHTLQHAIERQESPRSLAPDNDARVNRVQQVMLRVQLLLQDQDNNLVTDRVHKGLQVALELSSADEGFILLADHRGEPAAHLGSTPAPELVAWAEQNMLDAGVDEQTVMTQQVHSELDSNYKVVGPMRYCVVPLWTRVAREDRVVAALVLGFENRVPSVPEPAVMRAIAAHLVDSTMS
jgi:tetratricopeptide (TPR) repeat protein